MSLPEILEASVFLVENAALGRQPYPGMAAIYIMPASQAAIEVIAQDFTPPSKRLVSGRTGPMYASAHCFFTTSLSEGLLAELARSPASPYVQTLQELFLDFVPAESRVYHLGRDAAHWQAVMGTPLIPDGPEPVAFGAELDRMALQIASACVNMGELPRVRFHRTTLDQRSARLAIRVQQRLEELAARLEIRPSRTTTLVIVDRTVDLVAPLLHEFTVQAMATDLLPDGLGPDGTRYEYSVSTLAGPQKKTVSLDERDTLWTWLRHAHIADCSNLIIERFNKFLTENKAAVKSRTTSAGEDVTSLAELKDTMAALGEFHELKAEFSLHLSLAQDCLAASDRKKLIEVAELEQDMVTGSTAAGETVKDAWQALAQLLARPALESSDRARLLGLYLLTHTGSLGEADRKALFDSARLEPSDLAALRQLLVLAGAGGRSVANYRQRPSGRPRGSRRHSCLDDAPPYDVSRFQPALKVIIEDCAHDELDAAEFPPVKADLGGSVGAAASAPRALATSLRARSSAGSAAGGGPAGGGASASTGSATFVYVVGGCTYSEVRSVYELADQLKRDFFIGADAILTPRQFLSRLGGSSSNN